MILDAPDRDLENLLAYGRPLLPAALSDHLEAVRLRDGSVEGDLRRVPVFGELRVNVGLEARGGGVALEVLSVHKQFFGWKSVGHEALLHVPWLGTRLRELEGSPVALPGVVIGRVALARGAATLELGKGGA